MHLQSRAAQESRRSESYWKWIRAGQHGPQCQAVPLPSTRLVRSVVAYTDRYQHMTPAHYRRGIFNIHPCKDRLGWQTAKMLHQCSRRPERILTAQCRLQALQYGALRYSGRYITLVNGVDSSVRGPIRLWMTEDPEQCRQYVVFDNSFGLLFIPSTWNSHEIGHGQDMMI